MARKKDADTKSPKENESAAAEAVESEGRQIPVSEGEPTEELSEEDKLRKQIEELEDRLLRAAAEFDNYRKRVARQYEDMVRASNDALLLEFLEIVDNFERALDHVDNNSDVDAFHKGAELILNQMLNLLKKYDITPIEAVGQPFDPNLHEALMQIESNEFDEGIVAVEVNKGYRQGERVIRHSKVGVSKGKMENSEKE